MIRQRIADISRAVLNALETVKTQAGKYDRKMADRLYAVIGDRSDRMLEALAKQGL